MAFQSMLREAAVNKLSPKNFVTFRTSSLTMTFKEDMSWTLDGEAGGIHRKVTVRNHKQAVSFIIMPDDKTAEQQLTHALENEKALTDGEETADADK